MEMKQTHSEKNNKYIHTLRIICIEFGVVEWGIPAIWLYFYCLRLSLLHAIAKRHFECQPYANGNLNPFKFDKSMILRVWKMLYVKRYKYADWLFHHIHLYKHTINYKSQIMDNDFQNYSFGAINRFVIKRKREGDNEKNSSKRKKKKTTTTTTFN